MSKTPADANEVPCAELWPVHPGSGQIARGSMDKSIVAREPGKDGPEITWVRSRRAFRVDWYRNSKLEGTRWVLEFAVKDYSEK